MPPPPTLMWVLQEQIDTYESRLAQLTVDAQQVTARLIAGADPKEILFGANEASPTTYSDQMFLVQRGVLKFQESLDAAKSAMVSGADAVENFLVQSGWWPPYQESQAAAAAGGGGATVAAARMANTLRVGAGAAGGDTAAVAAGAGAAGGDAAAVAAGAGAGAEGAAVAGVGAEGVAATAAAGAAETAGAGVAAVGTGAAAETAAVGAGGLVAGVSAATLGLGLLAAALLAGGIYLATHRSSGTTKTGGSPAAVTGSTFDGTYDGHLTPLVGGDTEQIIDNKVHLVASGQHLTGTVLYRSQPNPDATTTTTAPPTGLQLPAPDVNVQTCVLIQVDLTGSELTSSQTGSGEQFTGEVKASVGIADAAHTMCSTLRPNSSSPLPMTVTIENGTATGSLGTSTTAFNFTATKGG